MNFMHQPEVFQQNPINSVIEFCEGFVEKFGETLQLQQFSKINNELSTAKAILQLSYYEIMDGPDPHVMLTGLFRAGLAVKDLLAFLQFA